MALTNRRNMDLTQGSIVKQLTVFAIPLMLSNLFQSLYNTADTLVVGRFVGSTALAAVGSTGALTGLFTSFFIGMGTGAGVIISQAVGRQDEEGLRKGVHTAVAMAILFGIGLGTLGALLSPLLLRFMGTPEDVLPEATLYLRINFIGLITLTMYNITAGILRAIGDSRRPFYYLLISGCTNMVLNVFFVVVCHMGVAGVSVATIISQALSAVLAMLNLMRAEGPYQLQLKKIRIDWSTFGSIARIGLPAGVQSMVISLSNIVIQSQINVFGSAAMAGHSAAGRIDMFTYMPMNAIALSTTTFVAQNLGAGKVKRARKGAMTAWIMANLVTIFVGGMACLFRNQLISLFTTDPEVHAFGVLSMTIRCATYFLFSGTDIMSGTIRGSGNGFVPMCISLVNMCALRILWLMIAIPIWHEFWVVVVCYPLTWTLASICYLVYYFSGAWLRSWRKRNPSIETAMEE
ncbi:MAG: MATE family efflux transporter [Lachnospiraceae bacterium]|nr:MATE family efflux transporter [Lachnospiraceae bacterium]